jgi:hypothetical protein
MDNIMININDLVFNEPEFDTLINKYISKMFIKYRNDYRKIQIQTPYLYIYRIDNLEDKYIIYVELNKEGSLYNLITNIDNYIIDSFLLLQDRFDYKFRNNIRNYYKSIICEIDGKLVIKIILDITDGEIKQPIYYKNKIVTINNLQNNNVMVTMKLKYIVYEKECFYSKWDVISLHEQKYTDSDIEKYLMLN